MNFRINRNKKNKPPKLSKKDRAKLSVLVGEEVEITKQELIEALRKAKEDMGKEDEAERRRRIWNSLPKNVKLKMARRLKARQGETDGKK